jgi:hypothetical protein
MIQRAASSNWKASVCYLSQKPEKSMSAQLIGFPYDPFFLFAIPTSCSYRPQTPSTSALGFLAPTYTPILWAVGIGLVGEQLHWRGAYRRWIYIAMAVLFTAFHVSHAILFFTRGT